VARDISDRILVEEELRKANNELKKRNQLRSKLAIMVSETLMRLLAEGHIDKARRVINDFLDISKVDEGKMKLKLTRFDFRSAVSEVVQALSPLLSEKNIDLESFSPDSELVVNADYDRIVQVLTNLINSSIKTTASNGYISVRVKDIGYQISVEVQDNGPPIESGHADEIFELFAQIEEHLRSDKEDLSLGLPLAKELVEMHGGCIWAESEDERGNLFCFTLPKFNAGEELACAAAKAGGQLCLQN
jgi:signal transduction histidine kinase